MEIKRENTGDLTSRLTVVIGPEDYRDQVNTVLKDYAKKANMKGFRPGMVPVSVVRKMFGKGVVYEELNKIVSKALNDYIVEERLALVGEPLPATKDFELDAEKELQYELAFDIGIASPFVINYDAVGKHSLYKVVADDALIDKEIEGMRSQHGEMSNPEESEEGDILFGKLWEVDAEGNTVEGGLERMFALNPERIHSEALKKEMGAGKKADDRLNVTMADLFEDDEEMRNLWEKNVSGEQVRTVSDEELAEIKGKKFSFEVRKINRVAKMPVDQTLFDAAYGPGKVTSESDFRDKVASDIEGHLRNQAQKLYRAQAIRSIIDGTEIELPHDFMRKWLLATREQVNEENVDKLYDTFLRSYKWRLIVEQMQQENEQVKVSQEHVMERARAMIKQQFGAMMGELGEDKLDSFVQYYLKDEKMVQRLFDEELEDRVFFHVQAMKTPQEEEVTATGFIDILKKENAAKE